MTIDITISEIPSIVASQIMPRIERCKIFAFYGTLGSGKTTFIKEILLQCGVLEPVTSPTFAYVNTYTNQSGQKFHHFDLYRMEALPSFIDAGFDEFLHEENTWVFIEWPECIESLLAIEFTKKNACALHLHYNEKIITQRFLSIEP